ncbi:hypothetical protein DXG03_002032 [Asterophora parasitica]|uniref:Uncharacterized protein n=1 Tax=Asterophora parasitica TaxID=117018 RepID=A0A9P7KBF5_9AGAR|nr:hypothetical protein DXG03_002032 [Asterophora parasitica]
MSQRHQAFVIAKIVPHGGDKAFYRCIAALHHQWCYGSLPLRAVLRMLSVVKNIENADIIRHELRQLDGKYGRWGSKSMLPDNPCPYTSFLLAASWNLDFQDTDSPYITYGNSLLGALIPADMGSTQGENNDGITVIDITTPEEPSYCFVSIHGLETSPGIPPHRMVPLSATQYLRAYYPVPDAAQLEDEDKREHEEDLRALIAKFDGRRLMTLDMLAEAWPREYNAEGQTAPHIDSGAPPVKPHIPSLVDLSLRPAVERALSLGETEDIEQLVWMPGKAQAIVDILKALTPFSNSGVSLLSKALRQISENVVDLSNMSLSQEQIGTLLSDFPDLQILKLSHNPFVTVDTIRIVLASSPTLRRLVALDTSLTYEALHHLITTESKLFSHLEAFTHPLFLTGKAGITAAAFSLISISDMSRSVTSAALPFFNPAAVVQALTIYLKCFLIPDMIYIMTKDTFAPQVLLSTPVLDRGVEWNDRPVLFFVPKLESLPVERGWFFALQPDRHASSRKFAFVKARSPQSVHAADDTGGAQGTYEIEKVLGLKDWLLETEQEGHHAVPASAVEALQAIFDQLREKGGYQLMETNEARTFCMTVADYYMRLRWRFGY